MASIEDVALRRDHALNLTRLIDETPITGFQITVFVLCALVMALDGFDLTVIGVTAPAIAATLHIKMSAFGPIFGAGQFGVMIGALAFGSPADRFGRKYLLISATALFGVFALLTGLANTLSELLLCRFITGLGLGGAAPNLVALISEYAPKRMRPLLVTVIWGVVPVGGIIGGFSSSFIMPHFGWRYVFFVGGIAPLVLVVLLLLLLPESLAFLVVREAAPQRIIRILRRLAPTIAATAETRFEISEVKLTGVPVKHLFTEGRAVTTLMLWLLFFLSFLIIVFGISWLPTLLKQNGASVAQTGIGLGVWSTGGITGSLIFGAIVDRKGPYVVQVFGFCCLALCIGTLGFMAGVLPFAAMMALVIITSCLGAGTNSAAGGLISLSYPTAVRATAIGWAYGLGRLGASVGPTLAGILLAWNWKLQQIFLAYAIPALCAAVLVVLLRRRASARRG